MKGKYKKFFLLGLGVAAAGIAYANRDKIKKLVKEVVDKGHITLEEGKKLTDELAAEVKRVEKKMAADVKKSAKVIKAKMAKPKPKKK
jgi:polyhydroxyalkanoate synthesis regulator phasin